MEGAESELVAASGVGLGTLWLQAPTELRTVENGMIIHNDAEDGAGLGWPGLDIGSVIMALSAMQFMARAVSGSEPWKPSMRVSDSRNCRGPVERKGRPILDGIDKISFVFHSAL